MSKLDDFSTSFLTYSKGKYQLHQFKEIKVKTVKKGIGLKLV